MNKAPTAWMLRQDGTAFPCQCHYYGNTDPAEVEETLYATEADTVTVLWDQESSGHSEYLTNEAGHTLDHVPLKEVVQ
jgi:hypothetical protein